MTDNLVANPQQAIADLQRKLDESAAQQAATSEILRLISQSPTNVQPVFDAIVQTAVRLIRCDIAFVLRCDGATFSPAAAAGPDGPLPDLGPSHLPIDPGANFPSRAIVGKKNVHLPDWSLIDLPEHERQIRHEDENHTVSQSHQGEPMDFVSAEPSIVRSIKQLDFLKIWSRLYAKKSLAPSMVDFEPDRVEDEKPDLVYYRVEWNGTQPRIRINSQGSRLAQAYGKVGQANQGLYLDDYLGPDVAREVLPIYNECIRRARPVYTVSSIDDVQGHRVLYERLLLPFSDGAVVTDIVGSLKTISEDGRFVIKDLFRSTDRAPTFMICAVIERDSKSLSSTAGFSADDVTDI